MNPTPRISVPHGGLRPVHQKSTCITQLTLGPYVVQIRSRSVQISERTKPAESTVWVCAQDAEGSTWWPYEVDSSCRLLTVPLFRGCSRFESLSSSQNSVFNVTCDCNQEEINVDDDIRSHPKPTRFFCVRNSAFFATRAKTKHDERRTTFD